MATFDVTPGPLPVMVAASPQVATVGDPVTAYYRRPPAARRRWPWCAPAADVRTRSESPAVPAGAAAERLSPDRTQALDPGDYELLLVGAGDEVQARAPFWVQAREPSRSSRPTRRRTRPASPSS